MSERFGSHAEADRAASRMDLSEDALLEGHRSASDRERQKWDDSFSPDLEYSTQSLLNAEFSRAAMDRLKQEEVDEAYERKRKKRHEEQLAEGALRVYMMEQRGTKPYDPTEAFREKRQEYKNMNAQYKESGRVDVANSRLSSKIDEISDEEGSIDVSKLRPGEIRRYRDSLSVLLGETGEEYDQRMEEVFGTKNYMDSLVKFVDSNQAYQLRRIAESDPGANPLADKLLEHSKLQQEKAEAQENS